MKTTATFAFLMALTVQGVVGQLALLSKLAGKQYFGTAIDYVAINDTAYMKKSGDRWEFDTITPSNSMKWETIQPEQGVWNFGPADELVAFAKKNRQAVRGHTCLWHSQLAPWVEAGNFDSETLHEIIHEHCYKLVSHYKGDVFHWDVVNEAFLDDGTFRPTVFYNTTGTTYFDTVFKAARAADPKAKLYINDYNLEGLSPKSDAVYELVKDLKSRGIPIDGVGVQGHLILGQIPTTIRENFQRFADLGVDVAITELDIRMDLPVTREKLAQQKKDYEAVVSACKAVKRCVGITIWDWTDKYSWVPGWFEGEGAALPWDEDFKKKPAYYGIVEGLIKPVRRK
ncbi:xylanase glycosyl hydrolase family 10 [Coprinopsis cinerea okayama7|uniref:Beta-xylanase n=1 Tax=Coprinopsis cinerea (strain Okayama-7 / 130 / ATCC MYA-4618 / FGSC 9003) TaxID=240176 RepID=A8P570_COPC7|nr:xylanase glycosyl hydrolase family 10 [Coprinopsis cinerea okayama7\|eukprot:XP_001838887.1 xylanase glycosyl hydrolase family 10 [Coprinopsis cinerea okayama7\